MSNAAGANRTDPVMLFLPFSRAWLLRMFDRIPRITLDTVFLDQDLRVSRLPDRNFLVYVKDY